MLLQRRLEIKIKKTANAGYGKMNSKSGQLKIQQMAFMLMAVTLFFVVAGLFLLTVKFSGLKESANALEEKNNLLLVMKLANSPEFSCGESFGTSRINCIDVDKVMALKNRISKYSDFWGIASIEIRKLVPESNVECTLSNYDNCGIIKVFSKNVNLLSPSSNYVALCRKESLDKDIYDKCEIGIIIISSEDKT